MQHATLNSHDIKRKYSVNKVNCQFQPFFSIIFWIFKSLKKYLVNIYEILLLNTDIYNNVCSVGAFTWQLLHIIIPS